MGVCSARRSRHWGRLAGIVAWPILLCVAGSALAVGPTVIPHVDDLIDAPRALFGRTRGQIEQRLGRPEAVRAAVPGVAEAGVELAYAGLVIRVRGAGSLARVELTAPGPRLPWGIDIGVERRLVEQALGEPQELTDTRYMYLYSDGYPDTVELYFRDHRVVRIRWTYWVE